jgi:hypothetical protein
MAVVVPLLLFFAQILAVAFAAPVNQTLEDRQSDVLTLSADEVAGYKPYTWYASTAGCNPTNISAWNCGSTSLSLTYDRRLISFYSQVLRQSYLYSHCVRR